MERVKVRTFSGCVCEQEVFTISPKTKNIKAARPRFKTEEERAEHRLLMSRRHHARLINENYSPASKYSTLTIDNENEVHTFEEARILRDRYARRLRYAAPDARFNIYMGRGKATGRIHFHMLSDGLTEETITTKWQYGEVVRIDNLRAHNYYDGVDHGQDYTGLANYLFDHWTPEQKGHRWKSTKNLRQPQREKPTAIKRDYTPNKPPTPPKGYLYVGCKETRYGYLCFKYVKMPEPDRRRGRKDTLLQQGGLT